MNFRSKSSHQNHFAVVPETNHPRSAFKCDHGYKTTFDAGYLIPFFWDEVNPGETHKVNLTAFIRFATLLFPLMDNVKFYTYYFYTPMRLLWTNTRKFFGEQVNPGDSIAYTVPKMQATAGTGYAESSIFDYFGLPTKIPGFYHNVLPLRNYNFCVNEWFRDENLQNSLTVTLADSGDVPGDFTLQRSGKIRDYFTSCLPFVQKGTAVSIPLGTTAPIMGIGFDPTGPADAGAAAIRESTGSNSSYSHVTTNLSTGNPWYVAMTASTGGYAFQPSIFADLTNATASTINDLRTAFQIQRFLERDARGGTRYAEIVQSHFNCVFPDLRYRPEYLGGSSDPLNVHVVPQTAPASGGSTPLANLAGFGTAILHDHGFTKSFVEHGILLGLIVARADLNYMQGLNRKWSRSIRYDYPWPVLAHLGEQAVLNKEIYCTGTGAATDDNVFGYQEKYAECRYSPNLITGLFRTNATGTLDSWHLAQSFGSLPVLDSTFIVDNPPTTRVKATSGDPDFIFDAHIGHTKVSTLPTYSVPGWIDHF